MTDNAIIYHKGNEESHYGVSRYPPYIDKDGVSHHGPPDKEKQEPPRAPNTPEPVLYGSPVNSFGKVGGNQDTPALLTQDAPKTPQTQPQQPQQQPTVEMNNSTTLSNLTNGLMALGKILLGGVTSGAIDLSSQNQTENATDSDKGI